MTRELGKRIRRVKKRINVIGFARREGIEVEEDESLTVCPFPDHSEEDGSFHVTQGGARFKCFGCSRGGDVVDFVAALRKCSLPDAVSELEAITGTGDPDAEWVLRTLSRPVAVEGAAENAAVVLGALERFLLARLEPYRRSRDPLARELADPYVDHIWEVFEDTRAGMDAEEIRRFGIWVARMLHMIERLVRRATGMDREAVARSTGITKRDPAEVEAIRELLALVLGRA